MLPPVTGELAGELLPLALPGAPLVRWKVTATGENGMRRQFTLLGEARGSALWAQVEVDLRSLDGTWRISEATLDASQWLRGALSRFADLGQFVGGGTLQLSGEGTLHAGQPVGNVSVSWRDGELRDESAGWSLSGISFRGAFHFDLRAGTVRGTDHLSLVVGTITTERFGAREFRLEGELLSRNLLRVETLAVEIAGGEAHLAGRADVQLDPLSLDLPIVFTRIGLQDVAALVPTLVASARGRVDGNVQLRWTMGGDLEIASGQIALRPDEVATVRLFPSPGLITSRLNAAVVKYYPGLDEAEMGRVPLRAESLEVSYTPNGDEQGRTAVVKLKAWPEHPDSQAPIYLNINARGPLGWLIKLGSNLE